MTEKNTNTQIDDCYRMASDIAAILISKGKTVSLAESITGGLIAKTFTDIPGSSKWFLSGIVSYNDEVKNRFLGVDRKVLKEHSAVSKECAEQMAIGAIRLFESSYSVAVTGYAGPEGEKVGEVYIATASNNDINVKQFNYGSTPGRAEIREKVLFDALLMLYDFLKKDPDAGRYVEKKNFIS